MFFRKKKISTLTTAHEEETKKADAEVQEAQRELSVAREMTKDLRQIRSENNFMNDFRAALVWRE
jgi:cellobiose-specific phosphotransferase system component IIA